MAAIEPDGSDGEHGGGGGSLPHLGAGEDDVRWEDLEMVENARGERMWLLDGELHSVDDHPSFIGADGSTGLCGFGRRKPTMEWHDRGRLHRRNDMPAVVRADGNRKWCMNGVQHRPGNNPSETHGKGSRYMLHGRLHRTDGPAMTACSYSKDSIVVTYTYAVDGVEFPNKGSAYTKAAYDWECAHPAPISLAKEAGR